MAAAKKTTTTKASAKTGTEKALKTVAPKTEEKKAAETVEVKAPVKTEEEKPEEKKPEEKKAAKKPAAQKAPVKKAELKSALHVQFSGKSYAEEELVKMAKDVWKYDLNQKAGDLESLELYVKPEESVVYYVMNKEFTGSFYI